MMEYDFLSGAMDPVSSNCNRPEIASDLIDYLNAQILTGVYLPGARLPSVRALMRRFNLCYSSTLNGINYLCSQGVLEKVPKRGIYVRGGARNRPNGGKGLIGVITHFPHFTDPDVDHGFVYTALGAVQKMAADFGYPLLPIPLEDTRLLCQCLAALEKCDALIIMKSLDVALQSLDIRVPAAGMMLENDFGGRVSIVEIDPFTTARQALVYFQRHGCRKVAIFSDPRPVYRHRGKIFEYIWKDQGGEIADWVVANAQIPRQDHYPFCRDIGYFFTSDHLCERCARPFLERTGQELMDYCTVLSVDGKSLICPEFCPVPTIAMDWKMIGRAVFEEVVSRLENPTRPARRIFLSGRLTEPARTGESRRPAGKKISAERLSIL